MHPIARINLTPPRAARDKGLDLCIAQIQLRRGDLRAISQQRTFKLLHQRGLSFDC